MGSYGAEVKCETVSRKVTRIYEDGYDERIVYRSHYENGRTRRYAYENFHRHPRTDLRSCCICNRIGSSRTVQRFYVGLPLCVARTHGQDMCKRCYAKAKPVSHYEDLLSKIEGMLIHLTGYDRTAKVDKRRAERTLRKYAEGWYRTLHEAEDKPIHEVTNYE